MLITVLFKMPQTEDRASVPTVEWISKLGDTHTLEYYAIMRKNKIRLHAMTGMTHKCPV
jgi:hypothetical protein